MAKSTTRDLPDSPEIDRSQENTGYWERSRARYQQDYKKALHDLQDWINSGYKSQQPLYKEVREGHTQAMEQLGILRKFKREDFQLTKERQRAKWRQRYRKDKW